MDSVFQKLYENYHQDLFQFLFYMVKNRETAEDLMQEVHGFIQLPVTLLLTIFVNKGIGSNGFFLILNGGGILLKMKPLCQRKSFYCRMI